MSHLVTDFYQGKTLVKQNENFHESSCFIKSLFTPSARDPCMYTAFPFVQGWHIFGLSTLKHPSVSACYHSTLYKADMYASDKQI